MEKITWNGKGRNPLLPIEWHIPDCEAHVMPDGRLYLYGSLDQSRESYCSGQYFVASTDNMEDWEIQGPIFETSAIPWAEEALHQKASPLEEVQSLEELPTYILDQLPPEAREMPEEILLAAIKEGAREHELKEPILYAPDCIFANGKYYLYFCLADGSEGVAVSERPEGPFRDPVRLPVEGIDPAVFIDRDGQAYYYWGQFSGCGVRLDDDMRSIEKESIVEGIVTEDEHHFHEGSSVRRRGDFYYYVFADFTSHKPTALGYAMGTSPLGPFTYQGIIIDNIGCDPCTWNNHGSIEEFQGQWYVFYHRASRNSNAMRRVCIEPIEFDEEGHILPVRMTSQGAGRPFGPGEKIPGYVACEMKGSVYIAPAGNTEAVVNVQDGDSVVFRYIKSEEPLKVLELETGGEGEFCLYLDGKQSSSWQDVKRPLQFYAEPGRYECRLKFRKTDGLKLYSFSFR